MEIQFTPSVKTQILGADLQTEPWREKPVQYCAQMAFHQYLEKTGTPKVKSEKSKLNSESQHTVQEEEEGQEKVENSKVGS